MSSYGQCFFLFLCCLDIKKIYPLLTYSFITYLSISLDEFLLSLLCSSMQEHPNTLFSASEEEEWSRPAQWSQWNLADISNWKLNHVRQSLMAGNEALQEEDGKTGPQSTDALSGALHVSCHIPCFISINIQRNVAKWSEAQSKTAGYDPHLQIFLSVFANESILWVYLTCFAWYECRKKK